MSLKTLTLTAAGAALLTAGSAHADFVLQEDWSNHALGSDIDSANGWTEKFAGASDQVGTGFNGNAFVGTTAGKEYFQSLVNPIADQTTGTLFFQFQATGDISENRLSLAPATGGSNNNPNTAERGGILFFDSGDIILSGGDSGFDYAADTSYQAFVVTNNTSDTYEAFISGGAFGTTPTSIGTGTFGGQVGATAPLDFLSIRTENGNVGPILLDDFYVDTDGPNLINPIPEPSALVLMGMGGLALLRRRTRA